jgi:hypothetical protein
MTTDNTVQMLKDALAIIEDEQRWTEGALFEEVDLKADPLCQNTKVCALGALALAAWGPQAVRWEHEGGYGEDENWLDETDIETGDRTHTAVEFLNNAADEVTDGYYASIVGLNDDAAYDRANRYSKLKEAFRLAIARAEEATA